MSRRVPLCRCAKWCSQVAVYMESIYTESVPIFIIFSLLYAFAGVILIAVYTQNHVVKKSFFGYIFSSWKYRICFIVLCLASYCVLMLQGIGAIYTILMVLLLLAIIDVKCLALPDILNFSFLLICIAYALLDSAFMVESFVYRVLLGFGVGGIFFAFKILYQSFGNKDIIGEADILILSSLGIAFGANNAFVCVFLGSVVALVYAIFLSIFLKKRLTELKLPFCFFIFIGTILDILWLYYGDSTHA